MTPLAMQYAEEAAAISALEVRPRPLVAEIQAAVCHIFDIDLIDMRSARRGQRIARSRQVAMYLCRKLTPRSLPEIGRLFGSRDHSTVIHAVRRIETLMLFDGDLTANVAQACADIARRVEERVVAVSIEQARVLV